MTGLEPAAWETFAVAHVGASAALLGLVFVGLSVNLREVIASSSLIDRAAESVFLLVLILLSSIAVLVPGQANGALALELAVVGLGGLAIVGLLQRGIGVTAGAEAGPDADADDDRDRNVAPRSSILARRLLGLGPGALIVVAGASLLVDGGGGLYWWAGAIVLAYLGTLADAWVLLIEILR